MALIGTSVEPGGVARIFFDLRKTDPVPEEASLIARAIERAFTMGPVGRRSSPDTARRTRQMSERIGNPWGRAVAPAFSSRL